MVLALFALVAFAGDMVTGGSELTKFSGYGNFRWSMNGYEDINPSSTFSTYSYLAWVPKLNEYADAKFAATISTPGDEDFKVCYAYLNLHFTDNFTLAGGQMNIPFGYAYTRSGGSMYFADRSLITTGAQFGVYAGKDIAAMLTANFACVTVDLALSNGVGMNTAADNDVNKQFTARLTVDPMEWLTVGGSFATVGNPDIEDSTGTVVTDAFSSTGMDFFAVADYPVSTSGTLRFVGEYMTLGYNQEVADTVSTTAGARMSLMTGYDMDLDGDVFVRIMPAVRYDTVSPWSTGDDDPENDFSRIDFCLNVGLFSKKNTLQIGARSYGFQAEGADGHTDIYTNWRMNF